jgi:hypothetical protein
MVLQDIIIPHLVQNTRSKTRGKHMYLFGELQVYLYLILFLLGSVCVFVPL